MTSCLTSVETNQPSYPFTSSSPDQLRKTLFNLVLEMEFIFLSVILMYYSKITVKAKLEKAYFYHKAY